MKSERTLRYIGLAKKAGRLLVGTPAVCDGLRTGKRGAVFAADDISDGTKKRLNDKCAFYKARLYTLSAHTVELAHAVGAVSPVAAVMITDRGLSNAAVEAFNAEMDDAGIE